MTKIKDSSAVLSTLSKTVALTANKLLSDSSMLVDKSTSEISMGQYRIVKDDNTYSVKYKKRVIYSGITLIESAVALVVNLSSNRGFANTEILDLDKHYNKYITDIMYYTHSYRKSSAENSGVYIDRILVSKDRASIIKENIRRCGLCPQFIEKR